MAEEDPDIEKPFAAERAKTGRAKCKKCKCPIDKDEVRIAKLMANPFGDGTMKCWHHVSCIFEVFSKQRATTKRIENPEEDVSGWNALCAEDKDVVLQKLAEFEDAEPFKAAKAKIKSPRGTASASQSKAPESVKGSASPKPVTKKGPVKDDMFSEFQRICNELSSHSSYLEKTAIVKKMFLKGSEKDEFKSDVILWCRMLLPGTEKRIYNLQSKALIKLFSRLLYQDEYAMLEDLEQGDVAQTISTFFQKSVIIQPNKISDLTLQEVNDFLEKLSTLTKEDEQTYHFKSILKRCTVDDLKMIIRLIKHDLRINAGPKHILGAVHDDAYEAFQVSRDLPNIIKRFLGKSSSPVAISTSPSKLPAQLKSPQMGKVATLALMTPVLPMLAQPCKSVEMAMEKCPHGMLSEVKYDGERIQVHKMGSDFLYYSRSLKQVLPHKVSFLEDYIPKAFPEGDDLILDAEILLIDTRNGQPLPFGSLGKHKKDEFQDANVCLFIFDIIYYNGKPLMDCAMKNRRKLLEEKLRPIPNRIMLSEVEKINDPQKLSEMIVKTFKLGLEGLVLKDVNSQYEPGKRHWLKVKKDYLCHGAMADSADLVVLGAWYGTGQKGGIMSVFLMGCHDPRHDIWLTVTKVHTGHDDATLAMLQTSLDMVKISKDPNLVPKWLKVNKPMIPDFVARDPKEQPVWEIMGAEFTNQGTHTADGISIRFPRVTRIRDDKNWETATNLQELRDLFNKSAESVDYARFLYTDGSKRPTDNNDVPRKRPKRPNKPNDKEHSPPKRNFDIEMNDVSADYSNAKLRMQINKKEDESKSCEIVETEQKKSPRKSLKRLLSENEHAKKNKRVESNSQNDSDVENRAEYYSFIGTDYIEYTISGRPLNWIEGRKPPKKLPNDAKPIKERDETKMTHCLLGNQRIYLAKDLNGERKNIIRRTLKTLGARILTKMEQSQATQVIHGVERLPGTVLLQSTNVPKSARHVKESWVEDTASNGKVEKAEDHAVSLYGVYCSCPCPHCEDSCSK